MLVPEATLILKGASGSQSFRPRMGPLASGRYAVTVTAVSADGGRSKRDTVIVVVPRA
jgi:hypothetical protein